jgi:hypothetical protein
MATKETPYHQLVLNALGEDDTHDYWCIDPECCNPPGYHLQEKEAACPACGAREPCAALLFLTRSMPRGGWPPNPDRSLVQCFRCDHQWRPPPIPMTTVVVTTGPAHDLQ